MPRFAFSTLDADEERLVADVAGVVAASGPLPNVDVLSLTHHTPNVVLRLPGRLVLKMPRAGANSARVLREGELYRRHPGLRALPTLRALVEQPFAAIVTEEVAPATSLASICERDPTAEAPLAALLDFLTLDLFPAESTIPFSEDVMDRLFAQRVERRLRRLPADSALGRIAARDRVVINGKEVDGVARLLAKLRKTKYSAMDDGQGMGLAHGDPHPGNVLVTGDAARPIVVLDANPHSPAPMAYDLGKLAQSFDGGYDAIMRGAFDVRSDGEGAWVLSIEGRRGRSERPARLAAGLHLIAAAPHHHNVEREAVAMLLSGIELMSR